MHSKKNLKQKKLAKFIIKNTLWIQFFLLGIFISTTILTAVFSFTSQTSQEKR